MKLNTKNLTLALSFTFAVATPVLFGLATPDARAEENAEGLAKHAATDKNDKTGTNPINFQRDVRIYNEYLRLNTAGDGNQNLTTLEYRTPFAKGKWQFRTRIPYNSVTADVNDDGMDDIRDSGLGDINFRLLTVPYFKGANAFAGALEVFLDTASEDSLGAGTTSLAPVVFYGRFFRGGFGPWQKGGLFAPGLQYKFSVDEDEGRDKTEQWIIDINFLVQAVDGIRGCSRNRKSSSTARAMLSLPLSISNSVL